VTCSRRTDLGAYVLGALPPEERRRVAEHVARCSACAAELAEFERLPALLDRLSPDDLEPARVTPSPDLFERVAAAVRVPPRRSRRWPAIAAAAAVVLGAGAVVGVRALDDDSRTWTATSGQLELTVAVTEARDGSALDVTVDGLAAGQDCELVVVDADGERHPAGEWSATYEGQASWSGWTEVAPSSLAQIVLLGEDGRELVRVEE
jgi:hypothetical protein